MKTAIEQAIEKVENDMERATKHTRHDESLEKYIAWGNDVIENILTPFVEINRQQILRAFEAGRFAKFGYHGPACVHQYMSDNYQIEKEGNDDNHTKMLSGK